jgi:hypothetical protein
MINSLNPSNNRSLIPTSYQAFQNESFQNQLTDERNFQRNVHLLEDVCCLTKC